MHHSINLWSAVAALWFAQTVSPAVSQDAPTPPASEKAAFDLDELARQAEVIMALVAENHIDPPTPAEMWFAGTRELLHSVARAGRTPPFRLPPQRPSPVPPLDTAEMRRGYLIQVVTRDEVAKWEAADLNDPAQVLQAFVGDMAPGGINVKSARDITRDDSLRANRYVGIGIAVSYNKEQGYTSIAPLPGGPMERAGGKQGDLIVRIDEHDAHNISVMRAIELISGDEGTPVTLEMRGPAEKASRTVVVTRGHIPLPSLSGIEGTDPKMKDHRIKQAPHIRYVKVGQIKGSTAHELQQLERQFRSDGGRAVIIDFRMTHSHDLHHAMLLADALLDGGVIGRLRTKERVQEFRADRECLFRDMPLAVLVDRNTSGSGEWIAAALQDNRAAVIIGEPTAGNSFVPTSIQVPGEDKFIQMATGVFERPSGQSFQRPADGHASASGGIIPDRIIETVQPEPENSGAIQLFQQFVPKRAKLRNNLVDPVGAAVRELTNRLNSAADGVKP